MSTFVIDCEFNGMGGDLISLALVSVCGQHEFYEVVEMKQPWDGWVKDNVRPIVGQYAIPYEAFQARLQEFLTPFAEDLWFIADYPDDIKYLMEAMLLGPGVSMDFSFNCRVDERLHSRGSKIPHNALEDARAILAVYHELT